MASVECLHEAVAEQTLCGLELPPLVVSIQLLQQHSPRLLPQVVVGRLAKQADERLREAMTG